MITDLLRRAVQVTSTLLFILTATYINPVHAQVPLCTSALSDPDNDGWGWENSVSCRVAASSTNAAQTTNTCIDSDGDGWGWNEFLLQSCVSTDTASADSGRSVNQPQSTAATPSVAGAATPRPYAQRDPFSIKALQTDFWNNRQELLDAGIEGVAVNFVWAYWEPAPEQAPCTGNSHRYANRCYSITAAADEAVRYWSRQGKNVTAILWGVPDWARDDHCINTLPGREIFCSTDHASDFGDFAGMLANRYRSVNGTGLINNFVIHNEVNMYEWYNHRCSNGQSCDQNQWIQNYADSFNATYDRIKSENTSAKVFVPLAHQYAASFDNPNAARPLISVQSFIRRLNQLVGNRQWKLAYHPYNKGLHINGFSTTDWPHVTLGNIGVLAGWLRSEFPLQPESWEIYLTESGYNSISPNASEQGQATDLCRSFYNALVTPGIENYIYHRMKDHPVELDAGIGLGLRTHTGNAKPAWSIWANASGRNGNRSSLSCGFENLPYTKVSSYRHSSLATRTSSRLVDDSYQAISTIWLMRNHVADAVMLYECNLNGGSYLSQNVTCSGNLSLGPVGYAYQKDAANRNPIYSCTTGSGDRYISNNSQCDNAGSLIELLGYSVTR